MAVHKVTRSNPLAQPQPRRSPRRSDPHQKSELFDTLRQLNRGYGVALAALHRLQKPAIFPGGCLRAYRGRTEALRALANRDLLQLLAGHEGRDAHRFGGSAKASKHKAPATAEE